MKKPVEGQALFKLNIGNAARNCEQKLTLVEVAKVGRKYFSVRTVGSAWGMETKFHLDGWQQKTGYSADCLLYETAQEWEDEKETTAAVRLIADAFEYGRNKLKLPLASLREMVRIIGQGLT